MSLQRTFIKMEGQMVEDRYQLQNLLGVGGFGGVFKGQDVFLGKILRNVAIKIIAPLDIENFAGLSKEKREAEYTRQQGQQRDELGTAVNLSHPHVVTGFHVGLWRWQGEDYLYLVMELAQGTLQDELRDKQPSEAEVVDIVLQVARGLDYLHREKRLIHRDVKPGNILRCQEQWKLSDFGLSRQMSDKSQSRTGNIAGSIAFMPPEAFGNESVVSTAWDMWSLGILGAALVDGGRLPFNYQSEMDLMLKIYQGDVKLPTRIPERLAPVVTNCLLKDRSKRWSAAQVIEYLSNRNNTKASLKSDQVSNNAKSISSRNPLEIFLQDLREEAAIQCRKSVDTVPLKSERGVDYTRLRDLLKAREWGDADKETYERMLQKHNRTNAKRSPLLEKDSLLRTIKVGGRSLSSLEYFPSVDLKTINELWVKASGGQFGFSVQKDIYVSCGAKLDGEYPGDEIWYKFCEKVGWRGQENNGGLSYDRANWLEYSLSLCFIRGEVSLFTPNGLLPCVARWKEDENGFGVLDHRRVIRDGYNYAYSLFSHRDLSIN